VETIRNRQKTHKLRLAYNTKFIRSDKPEPIYLFHQYGSGKKTKAKIPFELPMNHWDNKQKRIKDQYLKQYKEEQKWINNFYTQRSELQMALHNNEVTVQECFKILLNIATTGKVLDTFYQNGIDYGLEKSAVNKYESNIRTVINHCIKQNYIQYSELDYEHLQNHSDKENIKKVIMSLQVKNATKNDYFEALNNAVKYHPQIKLLPFVDKLPEEVSEQKSPVPRRVLQLATTKIKDNYQWLEAYLYFLLAFSLRGINGSDICMLNENWLEDEEGERPDKILHYMPSYKALKGGSIEFNKKVYICGRRNKSKQRIKILFNQFPTLVLHRLLKRCVQQNRPHLAYNGKDRVRIYNIDYSTIKGQKEWHNLRDTYSKQFYKIANGHTIGKTRHTFTSFLKKMNVEPRVLSISLGHTQRTNTRDFYVSAVSQANMDIYHIEVLQRCDINRLIMLLHKQYGEKNLEVYNDLKTGVAYGGRSWMPLIKEEIESLELPLSIWDFNKEIKLQAMWEDETDNIDIELDDNNEVIIQEVDETKLSKELQDLIKEKKSLLGDKYEELHRKVIVDYSRDKGVTVSEPNKVLSINKGLKKNTG